MKVYTEYIGSCNVVDGFKVLESSANSNWITFTLDGHWCQALVFEESSQFGIKSGRVSKLAIIKGKRNLNKNFLDQCIYNYDRGLDFNKGATAIVNKILKIFT